MIRPESGKAKEYDSIASANFFVTYLIHLHEFTSGAYVIFPWSKGVIKPEMTIFYRYDAH
jgi:hypothetical protein